MKKVSKNNSSTTVLTIVVGFILISWVTKIEAFMYVSIIVGILGIASKWLRDKIDLIWGLLAKLLSYIIPNILLSLVFYLFLTPMAYLAKLFGKKDPLKLKNKENSIYVIEEKQFDKSSFEKMF